MSSIQRVQDYQSSSRQWWTEARRNCHYGYGLENATETTQTLNEANRIFFERAGFYAANDCYGRNAGVIVLIVIHVVPHLEKDPPSELAPTLDPSKSCFAQRPHQSARPAARSSGTPSTPWERKRTQPTTTYRVAVPKRGTEPSVPCLHLRNAEHGEAS